MNRAIEHVLGSSSRGSVVTSSSGAPSTATVAQNTSPQKVKVVDLTDDNKSEDNLQRAIALSLQDGGLINQNTAVTSTHFYVRNLTRGTRCQ